MDKPVYIYVLESPIKKQPFYVGQTVNPKQRIMAHVSEAKKACVLGYWKHPKVSALMEVILDEKETPSMRILGETDAENANSVEAKLIKNLDLMGYDLTNREAKQYGFIQKVLFHRNSALYRPDVLLGYYLCKMANDSQFTRFWVAAANHYQHLAFKYSDTIVADNFARRSASLWKKAKQSKDYIHNDRPAFKWEWVQRDLNDFDLSA